MNVLHIALNDPSSPQVGLERALRSLGEYHQICWMGCRQRGVPVARVLAEQVSALRPDLIFMQLQTADVIDPAVLAELRRRPLGKGARRGPVIVSWSGDVRHPTPRHYFDTGRAIDLTLFTNLEDGEALRAEGVAADYLQIGLIDEQVFSSAAADPDLRRQPADPSVPPVVFLGNHYGSRFPLSAHRMQMVEYLRHRYGPRFAVYGRGWPFPATALDVRREAACYRNAKVAIHQSHYAYRRYFSDRLLRAMACGGAMVAAHRYPKMDEDWQDGRELVAWDEFDGLSRAIDRALADEPWRALVAVAGCAAVHARHTWTARMIELRRLIAPALAEMTAKATA